jgi:hypothetical protein
MHYNCLRRIIDRMSELVSMGLNKIKYKLYKAAYDPNAEKMAKEAAAKAEAVKPEPVKSEPVKPEPIKPKDPLDQFLSSFKNTFLGFLLPVLIFFICSTAGSIAANDAIGRHPAIRVVYFLYGTFPLFAPLVVCYYIYRYFAGSYPVWYNFLPLTTTVWSNPIMLTIMKPFTYQLDANITYMEKKFDDSAAKYIFKA